MMLRGPGSDGKEEMRAREREVRTREGEAGEKQSDHEGQPFIAGVPAGHATDAVYFNLQSSVSELELWTIEELLWNYSSS